MKKNLYPELMSERELAESFRELETQMQWEVLTWLREPKKRVKILEELMEGTRNQYRCAILITLRENADRISPDWRRFLLPYLLDLLVDMNGAVRGKAIDCAGCMIALECAEDIGVFQESLRRLLFVSGSRAEVTSGKFTTGTLRALVRTVYDNVSEDRKKAVLSAFSNYFKSTKWGQKSCVCLLRAAFGLPYTVWGAMQRGNILGFVRHFLKNDEGEVRLAALLLLDKWLQDGWKPSPDFAQYLKGVLRDIVRSKDSPAAGSLNDRNANGRREDAAGKGMSALVWISRRVLDQLFPAAAGEAAAGGPAAALAGNGASGKDATLDGNGAGRKDSPLAGADGVLYRENLDSSVPGLVKHINMRILSEKYKGREADPGFSGYASHLLVFMRLNTEQVLFSQAGSDLLEIMGSLEDYQKQEIMTELLKCVELEEDSSHYLPYLIGECWQLISASMQDELIPEMQRICNSDRVQTLEILMGTACEILGHLDSSQSWADEEEDNSLRIRRIMSGMLSQGLYSDRKDVAERTAFNIGYDLFCKLDGSAATSSDVREPVVSVARSVLLYMRGATDEEPLYRYLTVREAARYLTEIGESYVDPKQPVAFFTGSFDPFSNGHRAVAREVAEMGYLVYVNVDDFAWNRNTQPLDVRRKITMLSIADLAHVRIFPKELVINPDNPGDLARLQGLFPDQKVYLVCGSDRIERDEAYQKEPTEGSVHSFPHIVFTRNEDFGFEYDATENLTGEVIRLMLPVYYEHMTSLQIRRNLQEDKSIDDLVTIPARQYIRRGRLYADDRIYKREPKIKNFGTRVDKKEGTIRVLLTIEPVAGAGRPQEGPAAETGGSQPGPVIAQGVPVIEAPVIGELAAKSCHRSESGERPFRDLEIVSVEIDPEAAMEGLPDDFDGTRESRDAFAVRLTGTLLDEALLAFQAEGYEIVYSSGEDDRNDYKALLKERGFVRVPGGQDRFCTDLRRPLVLFGDASASIQDPFCDDPDLLAVQRDNIRRLRLGVAGLYPGNAVLFISSRILNYRLPKMIREQCGVGEPEAEEYFDMRQLAPDLDEETEADLETAHLSSSICVPFAKIYRTRRIPGLTTMALNSEKVYMQDLSSFSIRESAGYPKLSVQIRNLRSMGRPFVLVDDFYHDGFRMQEISRSLRSEGIREEKLIVGVISDKGRENAEKNDLTVDAVYEIPNMKAGILESDLIPFYGGDRVAQAHQTQIRASVYPILPYQMPSFLRDAPYQAVYDLSMTCLENAKRLFEVLETLYEERHFRQLTLERLGEVIDDPGCPETVADSADAPEEAVSVLLSREITRLKRFYVRRA